jgi:putative ABC transport system permease protein
MILEIWNMALKSLMASKVRSALSMLGIIIGVSTVIAVVGIGLGVEARVAEQFKNLSATTIIVVPTRGNTGSSELSIDSLDYVLEKSLLVQDGVAVLQGNGTVASDNESGSYTIMGALPTFFDFTNLSFASGETFDRVDMARGARKVILGFTVAEEIYGDNFDPERLVGQSITVNQKKMEIGGVLNFNGVSSGPLNYDNTVFTPYANAENTLLGSGGRTVMYFNAFNINEIDIAQEELTELLREQHGLREGQENDFRMFDPGAIIATAQSTGALLTLLLTSISLIILLVSGIGIMNVMLVTVAERTKEIGILKAIGAKRKDILFQFLSEAVMISMIGGLIGIALGNAAIPFLSIVSAEFSFQAILLGFCFSVGVGVVFGFYPALKGSNLDPVDALRSE